MLRRRKYMFNSMEQLAGALRASTGPFECAKRYRKPENASFIKELEWVVYRVWNAIKHVFGQSDWQIAKTEIRETLIATHIFFNPSTAEATAEAILRECTEGKMGEALRRIERFMPRRSSRNRMTEQPNCIVS
jgi:hypothetical protein